MSDLSSTKNRMKLRTVLQILWKMADGVIHPQLSANMETSTPKEPFEIGPMEDSCDIMLPYRWIGKYQVKVFAEGGNNSFESEECKKS
jgi:hypothetical protein